MKKSVQNRPKPQSSAVKAGSPAQKPSSNEPTPQNTQQNKYTNLIVGIIILAVFILFGGAFLSWYGLIYSSPARIAADAMQQLLSARQLTVNGTIWAHAEDNYDEYQGRIDATSYLNQADFQTTANLNLTITDKEESTQDTFDIGFGIIKLADGQLYLQAANIIDAFDQYLENSEMDIDDLAGLGQIAYGVVETIDGEWWQISPADVLETLGLDENDIPPIEDAYSCVMRAAAEDNSAELAKAYQTTPFLTLEKAANKLTFDGFDAITTSTGNNYYQISIDYEKMTVFWNSLQNTNAARALDGCYADYQQATEQNSSREARTITTSELRRMFPEDLEIYLEIAGWTHQIQSIILHKSNDIFDLAARFQFAYQAPAISAPESYRPSSDFTEEFEQVIYDLNARNAYYGDGIYYINDDNWD